MTVKRPLSGPIDRCKRDIRAILRDLTDEDFVDIAQLSAAFSGLATRATNRGYESGQALTDSLHQLDLLALPTS